MGGGGQCCTGVWGMEASAALGWGVGGMEASAALGCGAIEASAALGCGAMEASAAVCDRNTSGDRQSRLTSLSFPRRSVASAQQSWHGKDGGGEWRGVRGVGVGGSRGTSQLHS